MSCAQVESLWECITVIEAQEQLRLYKIQDWTNSKANHRNKEHRRLSEIAYPREFRQKNYVSVTDLKKVLGR
jgi:hypothetical protein